jgi:hypothetical protein
MKTLPYFNKVLFAASFLAVFFVNSNALKAQTKDFLELTSKTQQSYIDRGYKLVSFVADSVINVEPIVTPIVDLDYNTYYIVLVQLDGCVYCNYELKFVDSDDYLLPVNFEYFNENGIKQGVYKFQNNENKTGKFVVFAESELPYFANIFVFKK